MRISSILRRGSGVSPPGPRFPGRHIAQLGGTTTMGDCVAALSLLAAPRRLVDGPVIAEYERAFADFIGVRYAYSFAHGRIGLYALLRALGVGEGDEVLLQVPTHVVVPNAIRYAGARPVYVDCRLDNYNIDLEQAERAITPRTKVILLQHSFGIPVDLDAALALARRHGLEVIEDCVHALGARYSGRPVGSFGRAAFFSTEETKTISSTMGGMVTTDDPGLASALADLQRSCARPPQWLTVRYVVKLVAWHLLGQPRVHRYSRGLYERIGRRHPLPRPTTEDELRGLRPPEYARRLSNAQAVLALRQLRRIADNLERRRENADAYDLWLAGQGVPSPLAPSASEPAYVRYPVWVRDREEAVRRGSRNALLGTWFTDVIEEAASAEAIGYREGSCPRAEAAARCLINLPTHPGVAPGDVAAITSALDGLPVRP